MQVMSVLYSGLQDVFRRKGAQELHILKDVNGILKPVSACSCMRCINPSSMVIVAVTAADAAASSGQATQLRASPSY